MFSFGFKRPVLNPIAPLPFHIIVQILILVPELHCNSVIREGKQLLAQFVVYLLRKFIGQKGLNGLCAAEKLVSVPPGAGGGVGLCDFGWVSTLELTIHDMVYVQGHMYT